MKADIDEFAHRQITGERNLELNIRIHRNSPQQRHLVLVRMGYEVSKTAYQLLR